MTPTRILSLATLAVILAGFAPVAAGSELVDRNTTSGRIQVNAGNTALVLYKVGSVQKHVLYWGGVDWSLTFDGHDRSGGWSSRRADWRRFRNVCGPYAGPRLPFLVSACTAPDGSHWALQQYVRLKKNYGGNRGKRELRLSHWTGELPVFWIKMDWAWGGRYEHLYGQLTFHGRPVVPGRTSREGAVLDGKGRNLSVDSLHSDMGQGWRRVNAFLANKPNGQFCFVFGPKHPHTAKTGRSSVGRYRAYVPGPGLAPDLKLSFRPLAPSYDEALDEIANEEQRQLRGDFAGGSCAHIN